MFSGHVLFYAGYAFLSTLDISNPYWFLLPSIPISLLGGFPPVLLTFFCYITDITNNENRSWHLACLETSMSAGILAGLFAGPAIFNHFGYITLFCTSSAIGFLALLHVLFYVKETIVIDKKVSITYISAFSLLHIWNIYMKFLLF